MLKEEAKINHVGRRGFAKINKPSVRQKVSKLEEGDLQIGLKLEARRGEV